MEVLDGGQIGDTAMGFQQGRAEILCSLNLSAAKVVIPGASENHLHDRRRDYWVNCHPVTVNIAMRDFLEIERQSQENDQTPKETEKSAGKKPSIRKKLEQNKAIIAAGSDKEQQNTRSNPQLS